MKISLKSITTFLAFSLETQYYLFLLIPSKYLGARDITRIQNYYAWYEIKGVCECGKLNNLMPKFDRF